MADCSEAWFFAIIGKKADCLTLLEVCSFRLGQLDAENGSARANLDHDLSRKNDCTARRRDARDFAGRRRDYLALVVEGARSSGLGTSRLRLRICGLGR